MVEPVYTTRETIKRALQVNETARNNREIDRAIRSSSRIVEGLTHRTFYPITSTKKFDWPNIQGALPWRLWTDDSELISVTNLVTNAGVVIPPANYFLEPNRSGPPFNRIELKLSSASAFGGGDTFQQSILVTGLWGYANDETTTGLTVAGLNATSTRVDVNGLTSSLVGVGSIIRVDSERMNVTSRSLLDTTVTLSGNLTSAKNITLVPVPDGTQFAAEEILTIDAERFLVEDIAGNNLVTQRGFDGSALAAHTTGARIYAQRTLNVERGALGTTAATHSSGASVYTWNPPSGIQQYVTAFAISDLLEEQTGWFRTMSASSSSGGAAKRPATMVALQELSDRVEQLYTRRARQRTV